MRTKKIFKIGIYVILFICFLNPLSYLILGKSTIGKVVGLHKRQTHGRYAGTYTSAVIEFQTDSLIVTFIGEENVSINYGDSVKVIYFSFAPAHAKIFSIFGLFTHSFIELAFCLFIWYAFFSSFKTIFDKPLIIRKCYNINAEKHVQSDLPKIIRYIFKAISILFFLILFVGIISIIVVYSLNRINLNVLFLVVGLIVFIFILIFKDFKKI